MLNDIEDWRTLAIGTAAVGQSFFILLYVTFPWWRTFLGRALFYKALILGAILDIFLLSRVADFGANDVLFVTLYGALAVGIWWQFVAFVRVKRRTRHNGGYDGPDRREPGPGGFL